MSFLSFLQYVLDTVELTYIPSTLIVCSTAGLWVQRPTVGRCRCCTPSAATSSDLQLSSVILLLRLLLPFSDDAPN